MRFFPCKSLREVHFPSSLQELISGAFSSSRLRYVAFADDCKLTVLPASCFSDCPELTELHLHENLKNISTQCFKNTNLSTFIVPTGVESIAEKAFESCKNLETFIIPENSALIDIGYKIFDGCRSLKTIVSNTSSFVVENSALYNEKKDILFVYPPACETKYFAFSDKVHYIMPGAFAGCEHLEIMLIPDGSIETIGFNAFENCKNLRYINLPPCIRSIDMNAFLGCTSLKCGLTIEEKNQEIINEWISFASLPAHCTKPCEIPTCNSFNKMWHVRYSLLLFSFENIE